MARLGYGPDEWVEFDDRVLAHLQLVMLSKLRRGEPFPLTWQEQGEFAQTTIWVHPHTPLRFQYGAGPAPQLNRAWLEELAALANSSRGLHAAPEPLSVPSAEDRATRHRLPVAG